MQEYKFKFSVVIPIYNVEKYLEETIESVINQDIGFKENIQMILVNDGSPDNSEEICLKYKNMYPDNVIYVKQENAGVCAARNTGRQYIQGKYTNFLDSDDKWELDVFSKAYKMFEKNKEIDVIGVRQKFFEAEDGYHMLDYKFTKDRIVDIHEEYECIQLNLSSGFFRTEALKENPFDTRVKYAEDLKLLFEVILEKSKYGIIASSIHLYRRRYDQTSAMQKCKEDISYYTDTVKYVLMYLVELSISKFGRIIPYVQYYLMYELRWRIFSTISQKLNKEQREEYVKSIKNLLKFIDDNIIFKQKFTTREQRIYCANLKYNDDIRKNTTYDHGDIKFNNITIANIKNKDFLQIYIIDVKNNKLFIEGKIRTTYLKEDYEIYAKDNKKQKYNLEFYEIPYSKKFSFIGDCYFKHIGFKVEVPLKKIKEIRIMITYKNYHTKRLYLDFKNLSGINQKIDNMYLVKNKYIITTKKNKIYIEKNKNNKRIEKEIKYLKELLKLRKYKIIKYRILYFILRKIKKNPIWLVSDRTNIANDNGMHLFKYLTKVEKKAKIYFVINKKSVDYIRMKKIGKVLPYGSLKYKLYFLLSSRVISSQADAWVTNAFGEDEKYIKDLYKFKFVFLQHGIIKDDLSSWLHKLNKNMSIFVTSAEGEYNSIKNGNYGYTEEQVKLLGLPRYDKLEDNRQKQIVFMPTWRNNLSGKQNIQKGEREYNIQFKESEYFKFYNNLINDSRIQEALRIKGYKAIFCIHPSFEKQYVDFKENDLTKVESKIDYQKYFKESDLLITDFSSVAFDFAYLRKPVIYSQFDYKNFFDNHIYKKGYFSYEEDGFGPVCYDYESTVKTIIEYIKKDCVIEDKYLERINNFYAYNDQNNCKRVYEEILKLNRR